jgi:hypothetical protein
MRHGAACDVYAGEKREILMGNKRSLEALRARARELALSNDFKHWQDVAAILEAEGYPLAYLRVDLDVRLQQALSQKRNEVR